MADRLLLRAFAHALTFTTHFLTRNGAYFVAVTSDPRIVYVLWCAALFRSDDRGATFTQRNISSTSKISSSIR